MEPSPESLLALVEFPYEVLSETYYTRPDHELVSMTSCRPTMGAHASKVSLPSLTEEVDETDTVTSFEYTSGMGYFLQSVRLSTILGRILVQVYQPWRSKSRGDQTNAEDHHCSKFDTMIGTGVLRIFRPSVSFIQKSSPVNTDN
ncbi:hypothetical protein INS49_009656 [Diaporthe citri]|uniref:uncharacterized protein n=1 Tax=Diaporthe citri TaxID=83186 RepID=UPI001C8255A3|nr:uncharacterized protein INS49_009656 [Diaporthe citri]KAG6361429.1 hypothetical protein INS49_009656 [Diaporthe citri]